MSRAEPARAVARRAVIAAAAAGLGAGACGRVSPAPTAPEPTAPPEPTGPTGSPSAPPARAACVARTDDIPVGGGRVYPEVPVVVTQPSPGEFRAFGVVCTHDGCILDSVSDGTINCSCHGSRFAITDGSPVHGPARSGLRKETVEVDGGCIVVR